MIINNIIFYSHEKNGDCFFNKGYVKGIMDHLPDVTFSYAHDHHTSIVQDLGCRFIRTFQIPAEVDKNQKIVYHEDSGTVFINTWVGAWIGKYLVHGQHANFPLMHRVWTEYYNMLGIPISEDFSQYFPEVDYDQYDLSKPNEYLAKVGDRPLIIFCNGVQQSGQSAMGDMSNIINYFCSSLPDYEFLVTYKLSFNHPNLTYTDDLFGSQEGNLNQISYISKRAKLIIGKNSGPFTFCHPKENLNDENKVFMSFNFRPSDCLTGDGEYYANTYSSNTVDDRVAAEIVNYLITKQDHPKGKKKILQIGQ